MATKGKVTQLVAGVWPDLVGQTWFEAQDKIRRQFPQITIQVFPTGTTVKKEFSPDRVQIFVNAEGHVTKPPTIG